MAAVYVTYADLIARFDRRDVEQLCVDDGSDGTLVDLSSNTKLSTVLSDAEGEVIACLRKAGKYDADRLAALDGTDLDYLKRIICEIAMVHLFRRRPQFADKMQAWETIRKDHLKDLQDGCSILTADEPAAIEAGIINNEGPTVAEWYELNLWRDNANYFPTRNIRR